MNRAQDGWDAVFVASQGGGPAFLGATKPEWVVGIVVGIVVCVAIEVLKVATKRTGRSLPFVLLRVARISMPRDQRYWYGEVWVPELHELLTREGAGRWSRYRRGLGYALGLAFGGGRRTGRAAREPRPRPAVRTFRRASSSTGRARLAKRAFAGVVVAVTPIVFVFFNQSRDVVSAMTATMSILALLTTLYSVRRITRGKDV
ncbi:hypothetical protein [Embleya sp. NPDC020886]|uniref:hypothetical protein n=1 Tax=Embleya sp. NPDC020886 TaxID=3363980 RepID=UPI0037A94102